MFFFGFASGLPFLLVAGTLAYWLREGGIELKEITMIASVNSNLPRRSGVRNARPNELSTKPPCGPTRGGRPVERAGGHVLRVGGRSDLYRSTHDGACGAR